MVDEKPLAEMSLEQLQAQVQEPLARQVIGQLIALVESLTTQVRDLKALVQAQRDEIARLKGEQGKPQVRPQARQDRSSEGERPKDPAPAPELAATPRAPRLPAKQRDVVVPLDRTTLPPGAEHAGYEDYTVRDIVFFGEEIRYRRETYRDPKTGERWVAPLPPGVRDHFGPQVKALVLYLYAVSGLSEPAILALLEAGGLEVSGATLSDWLVHDLGPLHEEATAVYVAGLASAPFQQLDDTLTRVNGRNQHCQVVCNPCYTSYHTTARKDRLAIVNLLRPGQEDTYWCDAAAVAVMAQLRVSATIRQAVAAALPPETLLTQAQVDDLLTTRVGHLGTQTRKGVLTALAIAAYQHQTDLPVVQTLLGDDAGQFDAITAGRGGCWVHDARHYKRLITVTWEHLALWTTFRRQYWTFYGALLAYRIRPSPAEAARLRAWFADLFSTVTGYVALDDRIAKTKAKEAELLAVLDHPELPLHNNGAELAVRRRVRKRDVSFGPRTAAGAKTWDSLHTLAATAQQHGVNFLHYLNDRLSGANTLPSLASRVTARAAELDLGKSWRVAPSP
jgi:Transposase IS66 family